MYPISVWWKRVNVPAAMKILDTPVNRRDGSAQICRYMRQVLKEQFDRQFVFGLLLCGTRLRVFLCDRSGLLATSTSINILKVSPIWFVSQG